MGASHNITGSKSSRGPLKKKDCTRPFRARPLFAPLAVIHDIGNLTLQKDTTRLIIRLRPTPSETGSHLSAPATWDTWLRWDIVRTTNLLLPPFSPRHSGCLVILQPALNVHESDIGGRVLNAVVVFGTFRVELWVRL